MSIEDDISAVRAGRGTPDQQMTVVSVLDALLRPFGTVTDGILPDPISKEDSPKLMGLDRPSDLRRVLSSRTRG